MVHRWRFRHAPRHVKPHRRYTGATLSMGARSVYSTPTKQKLNTKSRTNTEFAGVNDVLPQVLWTQYFLEAQGYGVKDSTVYQDSLSTMMLSTNGKSSSSKRTRHIHIRFSFVVNRIKSKGTSTEHEPTSTMLTDIFSQNYFRVQPSAPSVR